MELPTSAAKLTEAIEAIVYSDAHDSSLRTGTKYHKSLEDIMEYQLVKEDLDAVKDALRQEKEAAPTNTAGSAIGSAIQAAAASSAAEATPGEPEVPMEKLATEVQGKLSKLPDSEQEHWKAVADRLVRQYTRIIVHPVQEAELIREIQASELGRAGGDMEGLALIHYDIKLSGEPITAPRLRIAPLQEKQYEKLVQAVLQGRWQGGTGTTPGINVGDCAIILDGGRPGNAKHLKKYWVPDDKNCGEGDDTDAEEGGEEEATAPTTSNSKVSISKAYLYYSEETLRKRRKLTRGFASLKQMEAIHIITKGNMSLP